MALRRVPIPSPNYSSRGGAAVRLIVCHTAEGARTYPDLGAYFQGDVGVSSHVGIDDTSGEIGEYVAPGGKAWCQANYNPQAICAELCAFAEWSRATWLNDHPTMLANLGAWIAEESARYGIPIAALTPQQAQAGGIGVCQHIDLGQGGGGHVDCDYGTGNFPYAEVLEMARGGAAPPPSTAPPATPPTSGGAAPPWPGTYLADYTEGHGTAQWQGQLAARGWSIAVDDKYGTSSAATCYAFQQEATAEGYDTGGIDGVVGPKTWALAWTKPVT